MQSPLAKAGQTTADRGDEAASGGGHRARLRIGQLVNHKLFDYRGVIVDVDATFEGSEDWYRTMARTRPPN